MLESFLFAEVCKAAVVNTRTAISTFSQDILLAYVLGIEPRKWRARAGSVPSTVVPLMFSRC